jgi:hypothetical protein
MEALNRRELKVMGSYSNVTLIVMVTIVLLVLLSFFVWLGWRSEKNIDAASLYLTQKDIIELKNDTRSTYVEEYLMLVKEITEVLSIAPELPVAVSNSCAIAQWLLGQSEFVREVGMEKLVQSQSDQSMHPALGEKDGQVVALLDRGRQYNRIC